jgi:hypothetical protein
VRSTTRALVLSLAAAGLLAAASGCGGRAGQADRLAEVEKRLDYLTGELADQRAEIERIREKVGMTADREKQP